MSFKFMPFSTLLSLNLLVRLIGKHGIKPVSLLTTEVVLFHSSGTSELQQSIAWFSGILGLKSLEYKLHLQSAPVSVFTLTSPEYFIGAGHHATFNLTFIFLRA